MTTSREHEAPILLLRERPELAAELLRDLLGVSIPLHTETRIENADFTQVFPIEFRADLVLTLRHEGRAVMGIIGEVQRDRHVEKHGSWPVYASVLHAVLGCQIALVVIALDETIARWASKPIETVQVGSPFTPLVIGPSLVPFITSEERARDVVELAVLSALVHGKKRGLSVGRPAARAANDLSEQRRTLYLDLILSALSSEDRATLEIEMDLTGYKYKSETFRRQMEDGIAEGVAAELPKAVAKELPNAVAKELPNAVAKELPNAVAKELAKEEASAVLTVLAARNISVSDDVRTKIQTCSDLALLRRWLERAATTSHAEDVVRE